MFIADRATAGLEGARSLPFQPKINDALMRIVMQGTFLKSQTNTLQGHRKITCVSFAKQGRTFIAVVMFIANQAAAYLRGSKFSSSSP